MLYFPPQRTCVPVSAGLIRFNDFVLDCDRYELSRAGRPVRLEKIPMELLILLVAKNGHLVTRQEIIEHLWGRDVFVDTEHGINTAVRKIRQALRDDPEQPRFVQTVMGKGYRFIAERQNGNAVAPAAVAEQKQIAQPLQLVSPRAVSRNRQKWWPAAIAALLFAAMAAAVLGFNLAGVRDHLFARNQIGLIHSIAVLPLENLSGDPSQEYFADGMTDELITALAQNHSLRVISRTSAMQYKGVNKPLREIAQALGVDGILEGSIERSPKRVHMTVQLIYAPTDTHVWAESYDRDLNQAYSLPSELSQTIAKEVKIATSPARQPRYINPEAHDAYLRGRYFWFTYNIPQTLPYFRKDHSA